MFASCVTEGLFWISTAPLPCTAATTYGPVLGAPNLHTIPRRWKIWHWYNQSSSKHADAFEKTTLFEHMQSCSPLHSVRSLQPRRHFEQWTMRKGFMGYLSELHGPSVGKPKFVTSSCCVRGPPNWCFDCGGEGWSSDSLPKQLRVRVACAGTLT